MTPRKSEGAPRTETPETPAVPPSRATRDERPPLETPETPAPRGDDSVPIRAKSDGITDDGGAVQAALATGDRFVPVDAEVDELHRHVAQSPVHAHAPVRTPRESEWRAGGLS